jgi:hypothetical protein
MHELRAALRQALWHASKLLIRISPAASLQLQLLMHVGSVLPSLTGGGDVEIMANVLSIILPSSLDNIETDAFRLTISFLYQQSVLSGVSKFLA